ncbi:MAG TPA: hypothetical protein GXX58_10975 [Gelria sp.]|nr:hypothetical protein [Gelria sp.]
MFLFLTLLTPKKGGFPKGELETCERPDAYVWNQVKVFGDKDIAVVMKENGDIFVEFNGDRYY